MEQRGPTIVLEWSEVRAAAEVGICRRVRSMARGRKPWLTMATGNALSLWENDITGAICECVYAKWAGIFWSDSTSGITGPDFVGGVEVKGTHHIGGSLLVPPGAADDAIFVLITPAAGGVADQPGVAFALRGWITGREAKQYERKSLKPDSALMPCHLVQQSNLRPMAELPVSRPGGAA